MGIIKKAQRERMKHFVIENLEDAEYPIQSVENNKIVILSKKDKKLPSLTLFLHSEKGKLSDFQHEINVALDSREYVSNIFYKDGENFYVRLGRRARIKGKNKSLKKYIKKCIDWSQISKNDYMSAMIESPSNSNKITSLLKNALTNEINSREMFMKGIDYSYYYEED